jgi:putative Ca2+/H+ antiporter (TMEM165/GDT1 family)
MILLMELGDKTQLSAMALAIKYEAPKDIYIGTLLGLSAVTAVGAVFGTLLSAVLPVNLIQKVGGTTFIAIGAWILIDHLRKRRKDR